MRAPQNITFTRSLAVAGLLAVAALMGLSAPAAKAQTSNQPAYIIGEATKVVNGHTIVVGGIPIRIEGVYTPMPGELFGHTARVYTEQVLEGRELRCELLGADAQGQTVGRCITSDGELGALVVKAGAALDCPSQSGGRFASLESARARELITLGEDCR